MTEKTTNESLLVHLSEVDFLHRQENVRSEIGRQIKDAREKAGLTLRELEKLSGLGFNHIARVEKGRYNVSVDTLAKLAAVLNLEIKLIPRK